MRVGGSTQDAVDPGGPLGGQCGGAVPRPCRRAVSPASARPDGDLGKRVGHPVVRTASRGGQVPHPRITMGDLGECLVGAHARRQCGVAQHEGPQHRMGELQRGIDAITAADAAVRGGDPDQTRVVGGVQIGQGESGCGHGTGQGSHRRRAAGGEHDQRLPGAFGQPVQPVGPGTLQLTSRRRQLTERFLPKQLGLPQRGRRLQQRRWVAGDPPDQVAQHVRGHPITVLADQLAARLGGQPGDLHTGQAGPLAQVGGIRADRHHHRHPFHRQPARDEQQRLLRRRVHPLQIVDEHHERMPVPGRGQDVQGSRARGVRAR